MKTIGILAHPGAGKTWAVSEFLKATGSPLPFIVNQEGLVRYHKIGDTVVVGIYDGSQFQGTDKLSMAVAPDFLKFFPVAQMLGVKLVIAEGDRINNSTFFKTALQYGELERIKVDPGSYQKLIEQRAQRGHVFDPKFLKTVASKVDKHVFDKTMNSTELLEYLTQQHENQKNEPPVI